MELLDRGFNREEVAAELGLRLLPALNATLKSCGLHIEIGVTAQQTFEVRHTDLGVSYPIYRMSDGEKSALLLAADVLTADANSIIMIDEPERHLHRAISAELVEAIVATRSDCAFVVLTHDVDLASRLSKRPGDTLSITGVVWSSNEPSHWQLHEVEPDGSLPEEARRAILGGRQDVLFIEGKGDSLDLELYRLLFPNWQLLPVGGCDLVIRSVTGLRESQAHHWINPIGIVDRDGRSEEERASLSSRSIHALPVSEIENLYLDPQLLEAVAQKQSTTIGIPAEQMIESANRSILSELRTAGTLPRIAKKLAKDEVARKLVAQMPSEVSDDDIEISFPSPYPRALAELQNMLEAEDVQGLMRAIPIRNTGVRAKVAAALRFTSVQDYQQAARVCVSEDQQLAESLREAVVPKSELAA
ncbi:MULTISPECIES: DUF4435 domain-containing protein [unclassified Microbacterium]|nr:MULTISPECIES: DUF4435 domain-containing protein [unclassified Microbacterium]